MAESGNSGVGRPSLDVDMERVEALRRIGLSLTEISKRLKISRSTLYRHLENTDLVGYTDIRDRDLDDIIVSYKRIHPHDGERMLIGHLRSLNIHVQRWRIRESIHRVDYSGVRERRIQLIQRRTYFSKGPNFVWHMDGNHKLIRWKFVIHGAVDGYSRLVTFLKCSNNNRASTVLESFTAAVQMYGLPRRLRTDLGGENVDAWDYMVALHGDDESTIITGSSVHNERIECLWRDVSRSVIVPFKDIFVCLEEQGILDVNNEVDLFCLHVVFTDRINASIQEFIRSWNSHPLTSENNQTPLQLFSVVNDSDSSDSDDGSSNIQGQLPVSQPAVEVSDLGFIPCLSLDIQVKVFITQISSSTREGCDVYRQVARFVGIHISTGCDDCSFS